MKEASVLGVLMYLFKYHMQQNCVLDTNNENLLPKLEEVGFKKGAIVKAFSWLANLARESDNKPLLPQRPSFRVFSEHECEYLDVASRGYILLLEQQGILNPVTREIVLNQIIDLEREGIDINLIKWVTLMVLFNQGDEDRALAYMEFLILNGNETSGIH